MLQLSGDVDGDGPGAGDLNGESGVLAFGADYRKRPVVPLDDGFAEGKAEVGGGFAAQTGVAGFGKPLEADGRATSSR